MQPNAELELERKYNSETKTWESNSSKPIATGNRARLLAKWENKSNESSFETKSAPVSSGNVMNRWKHANSTPTDSRSVKTSRGTSASVGSKFRAPTHPKCAKCSRNAYPNESVPWRGKMLHRGCMSCDDCNR